MRKFVFNDYKYHIITKCDWNGMDEKPEAKTIAQANEAAKWYLNNGYESVYVLTDKEIVKVFDKNNRKGRKPYYFETEKFTFAKPKEQPIELDLFA